MQPALVVTLLLQDQAAGSRGAENLVPQALLVSTHPTGRTQRQRQQAIRSQGILCPDCPGWRQTSELLNSVPEPLQRLTTTTNGVWQTRGEETQGDGPSGRLWTLGAEWNKQPWSGNSETQVQTTLSDPPFLREDFSSIRGTPAPRD